LRKNKEKKLKWGGGPLSITKRTKKTPPEKGGNIAAGEKFLSKSK